MQEQYMLIHEVVLEWLKWGNTEIPVSQLTSTPVDCRWHGGEREGEGEGEGEGEVEVDIEETVGITIQTLLHVSSLCRDTITINNLVGNAYINLL